MSAALNRVAARTLLGALVAGGARLAVVSPGSRNTPLVLALHALGAEGAAQVYTVLDERAAGFFALGLARASGAPVLLCCTSGSAGAHYLPALAEASASGVPLVVLTADRPAELHGCGAPQTLDQTRLFGPFVRLYADLGEPAPGPTRWLAGAAARALYAAAGAHPGPVHLNLPFREPLWDPDEGPPPEPEPYQPRVRGAPPALDEAGLDELGAWLDPAARGVVVVGPRELTALRAQDRLPAALGALSVKLGWPVLADVASNLRFGPFPTVVPEALVRGPLAGLRPERVLRLGGLPTSKPLVQWLERSGAEQVAVDPTGRWVDPDHRVGAVWAAEPGALCAALLPRVGAGDGVWQGRWRGWAAQAEAALAGSCAEAPLWEGAVARAVAQALPEGALLHLASSMPIRDMDAFAPALPRAVAVACNRGVNGIDGTLCTALGQAQSWAAGPVVALLGDLAFAHDLGALNLAAGLERPLLAVVVDNGGGNIFGFLPIAQHPTAFEPCYLTPQATRPERLAEASGAWTRRVHTLGALREGLAEGLARPRGLGVLVVEVDRTHNLDAHRRAWAAVARAVESP